MSDIAIEVEDASDIPQHHHHKHKHHHHYEKENTMNEPVNVFTSPAIGMAGLPAAGHDGFGLGGGLIGGLLLGSLLRNGGLGGGDAGVSGLNNLQGAIDTNAILSNLGDIKASVPLAEAQVQLALAGAQSDITGQQLQQTIALQNQGFNAQLATLSGFANTGDKIDALSAANAIGFGNVNTAIAQNGWAVTTAINNDGEKTRALISSIDRENLNRLITTQANEIVELRSERRRDEDRHGIEITMTNNQNQNQLQFQQQAQLMGQLVNGLVEVGQIARATNSNVIVGNSGATATGAQTASPTNVRA